MLIQDPTGSGHTGILLSQQHPEPSSTLRYDMHLLLLVMFFILRAKLATFTQR